MKGKVRKYRLSSLMAAVLLATAPACRQSARTDGGTGGGDSVLDRRGKIMIKVDTASLWVEVADRPETRQTGLMFRRSLPPDEGMLFVFEEPQDLEFWMKNTYLPLDIAFVSQSGVILNIEAMAPLDEKPRYRSKGPARYAIETNQGWFVGRGVKPGGSIKF